MRRLENAERGEAGEYLHEERSASQEQRALETRRGELADLDRLPWISERMTPRSAPKRAHRNFFHLGLLIPIPHVSPCSFPLLCVGVGSSSQLAPSQL